MKTRHRIKLAPLPSLNTFIPDAKLDFHTSGPLTNYEIEKMLSNFIEDNYIREKKQLIVVTGKGQVVRPLVEKLLKQNSYVKSFQSAGYFNGQTGAFEVVLN